VGWKVWNWCIASQTSLPHLRVWCYPDFPAPYPYQVYTFMRVRASTMVTAHSKADISISPTISIHLNTTNIFKFIKVWVIIKQSKPIELSTNIWLVSQEKPDLKLDEFVVVSSGEIRSLTEHIRKEGTFTDTGKRIQFNPNLWGEVWKLKPEHLALLHEKETQDAITTNKHQHSYRPH